MIPIVEDIIDEINEVQIHEGRKLMLYEMRPIMEKHIAKVERPQGEWIMQRHDLDGCFYTCSNCGRMIRVSLFKDDPEDNETLTDYPFCHCGADMRETIQHDDCL